MASVVGIQGIKTVLTQLHVIIAKQVKKVLQFLVLYQNHLTDLETNYWVSLSAVKDVDELDDLLDALVVIGLMVQVRKMLQESVAVVMSGRRLSNLRDAVQAALSCTDPLQDPLRAAPLCTLCRDLGIVHDDLQGDVSLTSYLAQMESITGEHMAVLHLFPTAAAATFLADKWKDSDYIHELEVFDGNEHCAQLGIAQLLVCFSTLVDVKQHSSIPSDETKSEGGSRWSGSKRNEEDGSVAGSERADSYRDAVLREVEGMGAKERLGRFVNIYLKVASQALLVPSHSHSSGIGRKEADEGEETLTGPCPPYKAMLLQLESFMGHFDHDKVVQRGMLDKYVPFSLLRSIRQELS